MDPSELVDRYPRLYHMAHKDAWAGIEAHGLLSTSALLDLFEYSGPEREAIESTRRPESVVITHPVYGRAVVRDNKPISDSALASCLVGIDAASYYRLLNSQVFFWPSEERLETLLGARAYRNDAHLVLTIDTSALVKAHTEDIALTTINSGATVYRAAPRGTFTFTLLRDFDFGASRRVRGERAIAEIAVREGVSDILKATTTAVLRCADGPSKTIWARS